MFISCTMVPHESFDSGPSFNCFYFLSLIPAWNVFCMLHQKWCSFHMIYFPTETQGGCKSCVYLLTPVKKFSDFSNKNNKLTEWDGISFAFLTAAVLVVCSCPAGCCPKYIFHFPSLFEKENNWWDLCFITKFLLFVCNAWPCS